MKEVLQRLADEADGVIDAVNAINRRMDISAANYPHLQRVKLDKFFPYKCC